MKPWSIGVASLVCAATLASAQSMTREELQKKADEAKKASCDIVKRQVTDRAAVCVEEAAVVAKINCADVKSYKTDELLTLNETCVKKGRPSRGTTAPPAAATPEKTTPPPADDTASSGTGRRCRALIGEEVVTEAEGGRLTECLDTLRQKVAELKCKDAAKRTRIEYVMQSLSTSGKRWSEGTATHATCR
jgi:hypothetical protein